MIKWFQNLRISAKVSSIALVMLVFMAGLGLAGLHNMEQVNQQLEDMYKRDLHSVDHWGQIHINSLQISNYVLNHIAAQSMSSMTAEEENIAAAEETIWECLVELKDMELSLGEQELQQQYEEAFQNWAGSRDLVLAQSKGGNVAEAQRLTAQASQARDETIALALEAQELSREQAGYRYQLSREAYATSVRNFIITMIVAGLLAFGLSLGMGRLMARPLKILEDASQAVSQGDLSVAWSIHSKDEAGKLSQSLEKMVEQLGNLIGTLNDNACQVANSAEELATNTGNALNILEGISASVGELAGGANEQAISAQNASEQTNQVIKLMAGNRERVTAIVNATETVKELVGHGMRAVEQQNLSMAENMTATANVGEAVESLAAEVREVGAILSTISQIAEQTNLLSLNAAIEAARAGEHGRGFAVVAEEVRQLAEESAQATGTISSIINSIQTGTERAVAEMKQAQEAANTQNNIVHQTSQAFEQIATAIEDMVAQISQMAGNTEQIRANARAIAHAVEGIATVSEQNAASTQEIAASTQEQNAAIEEMANSARVLAELAVKLKKEGEKFILH